MNTILIRKIEAVINDIQQDPKNGPTANHLFKLKQRLIKGQKLTKKMQENLAWIEKEW